MIKKGFKNLCNGEDSTSTLDQHKVGSSSRPTERPLYNSPTQDSQPTTTLEEMILQLEMEEKSARRKTDYEGVHHRMSCVNSSDILRSARNALNQYPRFSLDGKDAMYRSSFTNLAPIRSGKLIHCSLDDHELEGQRLPAVIAGESVIWCKPGVVAKLMGLDAMPIPLNSNFRRERLSAIIKRQNHRRKVERNEIEKRRIATNRRGVVGSCSRTGYCVMKPIDMNIEPRFGLRRFG